jgi:hypothetical protein
LRRVKLTPAGHITMKPIHWLWEGRIPRSSLTLLAGREGIGKSTAAYALAAQTTRGTLEGQYLGQPKAVIVAATEDAWAEVIVPRLYAAGADLNKVYKVDVVSVDGLPCNLDLPRDLPGLEQNVKETDTAMILLDPLMSRLSATLDTHKDAEVRLALEPLTGLAERTRASIVGLIHVNKSGSSDPLTSVMGSRAFSAVARSVLFAAVDPEDDSKRLLGLAKSNLGRVDLPTLSYEIEGMQVAEHEEGPIWASKVVWLGESSSSIQDALTTSAMGGEARMALDEAAAWLEDWLMSVGGRDDSVAVKKAGLLAGHSARTLGRARLKLDLQVSNEGFPRKTYWGMA